MPYWGMLLRLAEPTDAMAVARVHVRSWQAAYRGLIPDEYLDQLRAEDRAQRYDFSHADPVKPQTMVAVEEGQICGFVTIAASRDMALKDFGELCALYVDPEQWGRRMGVALVAAARVRLRELGYRSAFLWVLAGNLRAERFYARDGWTPDGERRTEKIWGIALDEVRRRRELA